jgi:hypothetical protein
MLGMPKDVVVPNEVPNWVAPPEPSAYVRAAPTVALRLPLSKSHWPVGWPEVFAATRRVASTTALRAHEFLLALAIGLMVTFEVDLAGTTALRAHEFLLALGVGLMVTFKV